MVEGAAEPSAPSGAEACDGLALSAENAVAWLPTVCNGLRALGEPLHHPQGQLQVVTVGSMLYFISLRNVSIIIFSLRN